MTITSFSFFVLITVGVLLYYIIPKSWQWIELLFLSMIFYYCAATPYTIIYLTAATLIAYASTRAVQRLRRKKSDRQALTFAIMAAAVMLNAALWFALKGRGLWARPAEWLLAHVYIARVDTLLHAQLIAALGMGYYTLQLLGYMIDCYWGNIKPQRNPLKLFLFAAYFPQLTTGPISRYEELAGLFEKHKFQYRNLAFGVQRILWGLMKKIVLAERVGVIVSAIYADPETYAGFYSWLVICLYPIQMYADFSGCMDIVLGVSELFDIHLPENFKNPFFARSSQEFWQRWHITLGTWARDYVLYPLLKSEPIVALGKMTRKRFGRKIGKFLVNAVGMFILWMVMGIWHGGWRYIVGVSLWYWLILMLGELCASWFSRLTAALHIKTESFGWHLFQSCRTYLIYAVGASFFCIGIAGGRRLLLDAWKVISVRNYANPWIFFDGSILNTGVTYGDINIMLLALLMLFIAAVLREAYGHARIWIQKQSFVFRWIIWLGLFLFVLIYGKYGLGYEASEFIYQGF